MATEIFLGEPPANIKQWIIDHATPPSPAGHADTWYKYANNTDWITISISGAISSDTQIPDITNVVALEIGTNVTSIGERVFEGGSLESVTIPDSVMSIGDYAFATCSGLRSAMIGNGVTSIGFAAFASSGLYSMTIPDSITSIGNVAFHECYGLTSVTIVATGKPGANAASVKQAMIDAGVDPNITWNMPS